MSLLKSLVSKYTIVASEDGLLGDEADSALMTEDEKLKKYGPLVKTFKSSSNPNKTYEVRQLKGQEPSCNCKGWANRKTCKHVIEVGKKSPAAAATRPLRSEDAVADLLSRYFDKRAEAVAKTVTKHQTSASRVSDKTSLVIVNKDGDFWTGSDWHDEYPEAEGYKKEAEALRVAKTVGGKVIKNYGFENEEVLAAGDAAPQLTPEQFSEIKNEMVKDGHPVRFLYNGQALNITTGDLASKGSNVIYHPMYWNFSKATAKKIAKWLNVKPVFDQGE
jgi:hypothetical protein